MDNPLLHGHTYEYDLGWMVCRIKQMIADIAVLKKRQEDQGGTNTDLDTRIKTLKITVDRLEQMISTGNFPPDYIYQWANNNLPQIIAGIVKYVVFGLSRDGYFVAYIPESWDFIQFDTIMDGKSDLFGHLVLRW